jgi:Zn-dependent metalloprotease
MIRKYALLVIGCISAISAYSQLKTVTPSTRQLNIQQIDPPLINLHKGQASQPSTKSLNAVRPLTFVHADERLTLAYSNDNTSWIQGTPEVLVASRSTDVRTQVKTYLQECSPLLGMERAAEKFGVSSVVHDDLGITHIKMQQYYKGIKIHGAELVLHGKEKLSSLNGKPYRRAIDVNINPSLDEAEARQLMINDLPVYTPQPELKFQIMPEERETTELVIYTTPEGPVLAYHITIHNTLIDRWEYFVEAHTGQIINKYQSICKFHNHDLSNFKDGQATGSAPDLFNTNRTIQTFEVGNGFYMIDGSRAMYNAANSVMPNEPVGVIWTIDAFNTSPEKDDFNYDHVFSSDNTWSGKNTQVSAHYNAGRTYEYFKNVHNRESINGSGSNIISLVNIADADGSSLENAFWNGAAMFYGNGGNAFEPLAKGLDVAAHEISHGIIQNTANLEYQGESGALNESYADVFGVLVDRDDWLVGEDVVKSAAFPSGALRSMVDPHNGASLNDYNAGFQPKRTTEQFTGTQDNGGVHINSGIPNHAFYRFANVVGKDKAEKVYYRALTTYLLKSSQFIDQRLAVIQSSIDLYGDNSEAQAARNAFDAVEIFDGNRGNYQEDVEENPGSSFLVVADHDKSNLWLYDENFNLLLNGNPLTSTDMISRPSITDDGSVMVFVDSENNIKVLFIDYSDGIQQQEFYLQQEPEGVFINVIVSRDGRRIAAILNEDKPRIWVYDFILEESQFYELFNPTYSEGVSTGYVRYADAMEFDYTGEYIMYDALNEIKSTTSGSIRYWDVGFIKVWNNDSDFWSLGGIQKLFSALPEGISVANPTFAKNSDFIIAFEVIEDNKADLFLANIQTGDLNSVFNNTVLNYPNYSMDDKRVVYDINIVGTTEIGDLEVDNTKINSVPSSERFIIEDARWGVWFANGERNLTSSVDAEERLEIFSAYPNPTQDQISIGFEAETSGEALLEIFGLDGKRVIALYKDVQSGNNTVSADVRGLDNGMYICRMSTQGKIGSVMFFKK